MGNTPVTKIDFKAFQIAIGRNAKLATALKQCDTNNDGVVSVADVPKGLVSSPYTRAVYASHEALLSKTIADVLARSGAIANYQKKAFIQLCSLYPHVKQFERFAAYVKRNSRLSFFMKQPQMKHRHWKTMMTRFQGASFLRKGSTAVGYDFSRNVVATLALLSGLNISGISFGHHCDDLAYGLQYNPKAVPQMLRPLVATMVKSYNAGARFLREEILGRFNYAKIECRGRGCGSETTRAINFFRPMKIAQGYTTRLLTEKCVD